jgi:DNA polymerase III delta prime subunit
MAIKEVFPILGHRKVEKLLANSIAASRVFPTWIFHGPFGIGKSTLAYKFAKCLLSETVSIGDSLDMDGDDQTHRLVDLGIHPDFFVLEQQSDHVSINDTRELLMKIKKMPTISKWRVVILENASSLNKNIHNSLLKILEDPPKYTVFIMICSNSNILPKTLLSRSAKVAFNPLNNQQVKQVLEQMNIKNAEQLSRLSNGSVGYALCLHENNGIKIYNDILQGFSGNVDYRKILKNMITGNVCDNFIIIKESILRILKIYINILSSVVQKDHLEEKSILERCVSKDASIDREIKKVLEIISLVNKTEPLMLDKNAVLVSVFEQFSARVAR